MNRLAFFLLVITITSVGLAKENILEKYKDRFTPIEGAQKKSIKFVEEFFSYNCNYCYQSEKHVKYYLSKKPDDVIFQRYQVNADYVSWTYSQAAFVAAKIAGVEEKLHDPLFKFYHEENGEFKQFEDVISFLKRLEILDEVDPHFFSDESLELKLFISDKANAFKITSVPTFVINGAYKLKWGTDMTPEEFAELVEALIKLEPVATTKKNEGK